MNGPVELIVLFALDSPADLHGMWYPPLRRALLCLSKLYRSVDRSTFQGLSQVEDDRFLSKPLDLVIKSKLLCNLRKFWQRLVRPWLVPRPR